VNSQSWPLQAAHSQLLTAAQPTTASSIQLSRSHESLMQSTVPRPLTFSQQIRPQQSQQLAVLTQKPVLSSVTRHPGLHTVLLCVVAIDCFFSYQSIVDILIFPQTKLWEVPVTNRQDWKAVTYVIWFKTQFIILRV